jgi:competence ComEA-like helix-hairpin-helix protein
MADKTADKPRNAKSDLNRADRDELILVPGIGPAAAESIVKNRDERGGFKSLDELSDMTGIGAQAVQNLRERFTISGKGTSAAESAPKDEAKATRRMGEETASRGAETAAHTAKRSADTVAETASRGADVAADAGKRAIEAAAQAGKAGVEALDRVGDNGRDALESAANSARRGFDEVASQAKDGLDAMAASSSAFLDSMQEFHREWLNFAQAQLSDSVEAGRDLARCRSPKDLLDVQMRYARSSTDRILTETAKLAELSVRVASSSLQPLQACAWFAERPRS